MAQSANSLDLAGKTALVTGAGKGIGRACVVALAAAGAEVIAVARTASDLASLAQEAPGRIICWNLDVTGDELPARVESLPALDILLNNAGTNRPLPMAEVDDSTLDDMISLNLRALYRVSRAAVKVMLRRDQGGCIVHMSSQMGHVGAPDRTVYCMTKHAVEGLTKAMAVELGPHGIRVNAIAPTFIETSLTRPMFADREFHRSVVQRIPMGRIGQPADITAALLFLVSPAAGLVTGSSLKIDGGWTAQ